MNLLELKEQFENNLTTGFELQELQYVAYAFGSGWMLYRFSGRNIKVMYDGKDEIVQVSISAKNDKFPTTS